VVLAYGEAPYSGGPISAPRSLPEFAAATKLIIEHVRIDDGGVAAAARSRDAGSACPNCGKLSRRVRSRYVRSLSDLPAHGRRVRIALTVRRFRCGNDICPQEIFAERFGEDIVAP
jgi:transposase